MIHCVFDENEAGKQARALQLQHPDGVHHRYCHKHAQLQNAASCLGHVAEQFQRCCRGTLSCEGAGEALVTSGAARKQDWAVGEEQRQQQCI